MNHVCRKENRNETLIENKISKLSPKLFGMLRQKLIEHKVRHLKLFDDLDIVYGNKKLQA